MKRINVVEKLQNIVARNVDKEYRKDFDLDKEILATGGSQAYYFLTRSSGTVLIPENEMNGYAKEVWEYYTANQANKQYLITVESVLDQTVFGTVKLLNGKRAKRKAA